MLRALFFSACFLSGIAFADGAAAQASIAEAGRLIDRARFEDARSMLDQIEESARLSRADLVQLYFLRARASHAIGDRERVEGDLVRLATLEPRYEMPSSVSPGFRRAFREVADESTQPVRVEVRGERNAVGIRVRALVSDDVAGIVQEVRLGVRTPGGEWQRTTGTPLDLGISDGAAQVEVFVEAIGPAHAVIANVAAESDPLRTTVARLVGEEPRTPNGDQQGRPQVDGPTTQGEGVPAWPFIVGGIVVAAAIGIALAVALSGPTDQTTIGRPSVGSLTIAFP